MLRKSTMMVFLNRSSSKRVLAGVISLLCVVRLSAQTVLLDESFEAKNHGEYPPAIGWTTPNDDSGWYPTVSTAPRLATVSPSSLCKLPHSQFLPLNSQFIS